jgi:hypothetical protein
MGRASFLHGPELTQLVDWIERDHPSAAWTERYGGELDLVMTYLRNSAEAERQGVVGKSAGRRQEPNGVFICYRRDDSAGDARMIAACLVKRFGPRRVFMDVDSIAPGSEFENVLHETLRSCAVVLVLIGIHWLTIFDDEGRRRLDNSGDYVRREVRDAMNTGRTVIPVLLGRAKMPAEDKLPPDLKRLVKLQGFELRHERFQADLSELVKYVVDRVGQPGPTVRLRQGLTKALQWTRLTPRY